MVGRKDQPRRKYRFGYNGQEKEDDITSSGYAFDYRIYDPRTARFLSIDPLIKEYPHYTPYSFCGNKPIGYIEREGLEEEGVAVFCGPPGWLYIGVKWVIIGVIVYQTTVIVVEHSDEIVAPFVGRTPLEDVKPITRTIPDEKVVTDTDTKPEPNKNPNKDPKPTVPPSSGPKLRPFWVTYTREKVDDDGNTTYYVGRTKGYYDATNQAGPTRLDAQKAVNKRLLSPYHVLKTKEGYGLGDVDEFSKMYDPIRGREQQMIDLLGGSQSDGGTTGNVYRGVGKDNPNGLTYHDAASKEFGEVHPYTGNLKPNPANQTTNEAPEL